MPGARRLGMWPQVSLRMSCWITLRNEYQMDNPGKLVSDNAQAPNEVASDSISGRAVFAVDMSPAGLVVRTAFLTQQQQLLEMPAVFPNLQYALAQIDELRQIVIDRFAQAANVGIQVMASQAALRSGEPASQPEGPAKPVEESVFDGRG